MVDTRPIYGGYEEIPLRTAQKPKPVEQPKYKTLPELGDVYRITRDGSVWAMRILKTGINKRGFRTVNIRDMQGKQHTYLLHMLIARLYVDQPQGRTRVRFKDGDRLNCSADNLEWI